MKCSKLVKINGDKIKSPKQIKFEGIYVARTANLFLLSVDNINSNMTWLTTVRNQSSFSRKREYEWCKTVCWNLHSCFLWMLKWWIMNIADVQDCSELLFSSLYIIVCKAGYFLPTKYGAVLSIVLQIKWRYITYYI